MSLDVTKDQPAPLWVLI